MRRNQILSIIDAVADINGIVNDVTFEEFAMPTAKVETPRFKLSEENKDDDIIQAFANCGRERTGKEDVILFGNFDEDLFKKNFAELNETAQRVLQLISEETPFDAVMEATETRATELAKIYQRLTDLGLIEVDGTITQSGKIQVARQDIARIETVYSYEVKPSYGAEVIPTTRPFCKKMIELSQTRFWTIEDINAISSRFGMDVWRYRGGWYHNPDTGKNEPSCRHYWKQNVIFR